MVKKDSVVVVKAERDMFRRLLVVSGGGRNVDITNILYYELSPVPLALAEKKHKQHSTHKSALTELLTGSIEVETTGMLPKSDLLSCLLIDGHALIQARRGTDIWRSCRHLFQQLHHPEKIRIRLCRLLQG